MLTQTQKNWIEIDTRRLRKNLKTIRKQLHSNVSLMAVVKSDAYGQGVSKIVSVLYDEGLRSFGVGNLDEAVQLRFALPEATIYILGPSFLDGAEQIIKGEFIPLVSSYALLERLNVVARQMKRKANVHLLMDTGMGRIGLWYEMGEDFIKRLGSLENVHISGIASHFSSIDCDLDFSRQQMQHFDSFLEKLRSLLQNKYIVHTANSGALLRMKDCQYDMVRVGLLLYGIYPSNNMRSIAIEPVVSWKSQIAFIKIVEPGRSISYGHTYISEKRTKIGTIPVGYCHGYLRALSNRGEVIVSGKVVPIVGRITMDQMMLDLGIDSTAEVGDEVVLLGKQGASHISLEQLAYQADTIPYEILCNMKGARIYI